MIGAGSVVLLALGAPPAALPLGLREIAQENAQGAVSAAQESKAAAFEPDEGRLVIDILVPPEPSEGQGLAYEACIAEQDAARIRGEIIVCRQIEDGAAVSGFDKEKWERDYAQRTQGAKTPNLDSLAGGPLYRADGSVFMVTVTTKIGDPPPPALFIDVTALPKAAPGSDADRVARGLAPLGED